jgi:hypothetical protein
MKNYRKITTFNLGVLALLFLATANHAAEVRRHFSSDRRAR